jgi:hypothetical protein
MKEAAPPSSGAGAVDEAMKAGSVPVRSVHSLGWFRSCGWDRILSVLGQSFRQADEGDLIRSPGTRAGAMMKAVWSGSLHSFTESPRLSRVAAQSVLSC